MEQMKGREIMKALASDFDGTLYLHEGEHNYREEDITGIGDLQKQGYLFGLCTGRPLRGITDFLSKRLHPDFYLKSRQNTPTSVVDEQVGDECSHISFHLVFFLFFTKLS